MRAGGERVVGGHPTQNMKGEKMLDKMSARCVALNVESGPKNISTALACWPTVMVTKSFSTFDTRDLDKSQPQMDCGTHIITGGSGKYKGITGANHSPVSQCRHWLVPAAISQWTSRITLVGD